MIRRRTFLQLPIGAGACLVGSGCAAPATPAIAPTPAAHLAAVLPLTGKDSTAGLDVQKGVALAMTELNTPAVRGDAIAIESSVEDDASNVEGLSLAIRRLGMGGVSALIGEVSTNASVYAGGFALQAGVAMVTPTATGAEVTSNPWMFRSCFAHGSQGAAAASYAVSTLGVKDLTMVFVSDDGPSNAVAEDFRQAARKLGAVVSARYNFTTRNFHFPVVIDELKRREAGFVFAPIPYRQMWAFAEQAKAAQLALDSFLGWDDWNDDEYLHSVCEGASYLNHWHPDVPTPASQAFLSAYVAAHGERPGTLAALGYEATRLVADAIRRAASTERDAIRAALASTVGFEGLTGPISFRDTQDAIKTCVVARITGGEPVFVDLVPPG